MRAILSVSNKTGLVDFARGLVDLEVEIFSTGGTKKTLLEAGVPVRSISDITGFPEILDGRVKTLHPAVHGGILARRDLPSHVEELAASRIGTIDMVVVNLYPFVQTVTRPDATMQDALENIDIGGPTLIRAAAKNFPHVIVVVAPADYPLILERLRSGKMRQDERRRLAQKAFQHVAMYDTAIAQYLFQGEGGFPEDMTIAIKKRFDLRYGENPHQSAAFYREERVGAVKENNICTAKQLWGKDLSFNNILDADAAWNAAGEFSEPTVAIIKHTNPCGLASHPDLAEAYRRALSGDPVSAFGGIVAVNRPLTLAIAREIIKTFYEIVIAPGYESDAVEVLKTRKDLRILDMGPMEAAVPAGLLDFRRVGGGLLVQTPDNLAEDPRSWRVATRREPTPEEMESLTFAWKVAKYVKSNAIVLAKGTTLLGMGAGQPSRVDSAEIALKKAGAEAKGSVMASDAMLPFPDALEIAARGGVTAVVQPGGSLRDAEVTEAADSHDLAMIFTGVRHFRH
ncbi:bifunctional phosphoribosylaminoimidazolecarboxamide formyltransferase/IMP cyclohydrolase [Dehalococcoidia bacterium]|nr:bifunctional phosphoribosylaminoimidazolecarboxamide formyltransferase/IMP cyclohydrolase [Dehalococcoidia bacterium]MCL0104698.1 bifunctional phosphoribosylaminoimidazolecarboxamide formyltransferase/IMP cyclohydrolase [Dehalococcoidia bacterium]